MQRKLCFQDIRSWPNGLNHMVRIAIKYKQPLMVKGIMIGIQRQDVGSIMRSTGLRSYSRAGPRKGCVPMFCINTMWYKPT